MKMKKFIGFIVIIVLLNLSSICVYAANNYYDVLSEICHGTPKLYTEKTLTASEINQLFSSEDENWWQNFDECDGIYHLDTIDMDNDGIKELIFSFAEGEYSEASGEIEANATLFIYTLQNDKPLKIYEENKYSVRGYGSGWKLGISNINGINYLIVNYYGVEGASASNYQIYKKQGNSIELECELHSIDYLYDDNIEYSKIVNGIENSINETEFKTLATKYMNYVGVGIDGSGYGNQPFYEPSVIINKAIDINSIVSNNDNISKPIEVILNGNTLSFDQPPYIENGTTRVPMRAIFEPLGAIVDYDATKKTVTATKDGTTIKLVTGATTAKINGNTAILSASVENKNGYTMVPLRFVSEALGAEVIWDGKNKIITINSKDGSELAEMIFEVSDTSLSFNENDTIIFGIGLSGTSVSQYDLNNLTLSIDDHSNIEPIDSKVTDQVKYFEMKAINNGITYLHAENPKTGEKKTFEVSVNKDIYFSIDNPTQTTIDNKEANINNFSGIYIDDYKYNKFDNGSCNVTFNAYNRRYSYGVVEVYNGNNQLISFIPIEKNEINSKNANEDAGNLMDTYGGVTEKTMFIYKQESATVKKTPISIKVPKGGYFRITNDARESDIVEILNVLDISMKYKSFFDVFEGRASTAYKNLNNSIDLNKLLEIYKKQEFNNKSGYYIDATPFINIDIGSNIKARPFFLSSISYIANNYDFVNLYNLCAKDSGTLIEDDIFEYDSNTESLAIKEIYNSNKGKDLLLESLHYSRSMNSGVIVVKN